MGREELLKIKADLLGGMYPDSVEEERVVVSNPGEGVEDVPSWLESMGLGKYIEKFQEEEYDDLELIRGFNSNELSEMFEACNVPKEKANEIIQLLNNDGSSERYVVPSSPSTIPDWLSMLGISNYAAKFAEEEYDDLELVKGFNEDEISEMIETINMEPADAKKIRDNLSGVRSVENSQENSRVVIKTVEQWLQSIGLDSYMDKFADEEYDDLELIKNLMKMKLLKWLKLLEWIKPQLKKFAKPCCFNSAIAISTITVFWMILRYLLGDFW